MWLIVIYRPTVPYALMANSQHLSLLSTIASLPHLDIARIPTTAENVQKKNTPAVAAGE